MPHIPPTRSSSLAIPCACGRMVDLYASRPWQIFKKLTLSRNGPDSGLCATDTITENNLICVCRFWPAHTGVPMFRVCVLAAAAGGWLAMRNGVVSDLFSVGRILCWWFDRIADVSRVACTTMCLVLSRPGTPTASTIVSFRLVAPCNSCKSNTNRKNNETSIFQRKISPDSIFVMVSIRSFTTLKIACNEKMALRRSADLECHAIAAHRATVWACNWVATSHRRSATRLREAQLSDQTEYLILHLLIWFHLWFVFIALLVGCLTIK